MNMRAWISSIFPAALLVVHCSVSSSEQPSLKENGKRFFESRYGPPEKRLPREEIVKRCLEDLDLHFTVLPYRGYFLEYYHDVANLLLNNGQAGTLEKIEGYIRTCDAIVRGKPPFRNVGDDEAVYYSTLQIILSESYLKIILNCGNEQAFGGIFLQFIVGDLPIPLHIAPLIEYAERIRGRENREKFYDLLWSGKARCDEVVGSVLGLAFRSPDLRPTEGEVTKLLHSTNPQVVLAIRCFCRNEWPECRIPQEDYLRMIQSSKFHDVNTGIMFLVEYLHTDISIGRKEDIYQIINAKMKQAEAMWEKGEQLEGLERPEHMLELIAFPLVVMTKYGDRKMMAFSKNKADDLAAHIAWLTAQAEKKGLHEYLEAAQYCKRQFDKMQK